VVRKDPGTKLAASVGDSDAKRQSKHEDHGNAVGTRAALPLAKSYEKELF